MSDTGHERSKDHYLRAEELTLPLLEDLVESLRWRIEIIRHRLEEDRVGWEKAPELPGRGRFEGLACSHRDHVIRRLLRLTLAVLEPY